MDSSTPRYSEKASYYSAVCLETGEVKWMELEGNSNSGTSAAFLGQLRERHSGRLNVIWDNAPAHRGEAVEEERGPTSREFGFTEKAVKVTVKNVSSATMTIQDIRLMFTREYGAPVLTEAPTARSHPTLPAKLDPGTGDSWYFPAGKLSSLLELLLGSTHLSRAVTEWATGAAESCTTDMNA